MEFCLLQDYTIFLVPCTHYYFYVAKGVPSTFCSLFGCSLRSNTFHCQQKENRIKHYNMKIINQLTLALVVAVSIIANCSCSTNKQNITKSIKYSQAKNYFVLNTVDKASLNVIGSQQDFDSLFGAAATMGKDGEPTAIDFDKQSVIAVIMSPTDHPTTLEAVSLLKKAQKITFTYKAIAE